MNAAPGLRRRLTLWFAGAATVALLAFSGAVLTVIWLEAHDEATEGPEVEKGEDPYDLVREVLVAMGIALPLAAVAAGLLGYAVAGRALAPMREAARRARAAQASELSLELPVGGRGDEWDELATTLNALLREARASLDRTRRFTADAAHELRTPLTAIIGESEVALRKERTAEELKRSLGEIHAEGQRLSRLVEALLLLSRADAGVLLQQRGEVSAVDVAQEAVGRARRSMTPGRDVTLALETGGAPPTLTGDASLLARAVGNVVDNATRFARSQVTVRVDCREGGAEVRVIDDGPGIPAGQGEAVFERFEQVDPSRAGEGVGLGLPLARAIARAHGGDLSFDGAAPHTTFVFRFPSAPIAAPR